MRGGITHGATLRPGGSRCKAYARATVSDEQQTPEKPFTSKLYFGVALPVLTHNLVPLNASGLVREWEHSVDPIGGLVMAADLALKNEPWRFADRFIVPTSETAYLARAAGREERLVERFAKSEVIVDVEIGGKHEGEVKVSTMVVDGGPEPDTLANNAMAVILGLAIISATFGPGVNGIALARKVDEAQSAA